MSRQGVLPRFILAAALVTFVTGPAAWAAAQPAGADPQSQEASAAVMRDAAVPFGVSPRARVSGHRAAQADSEHADSGQTASGSGTRRDTRYRRLAFDEVIIYEFFMPLTNEPQLRAALDALFYKDTIVAKLKAIGLPQLQQHFARRDGERDEAYFERICAWVDDHFVGYSIYHVDGRFRGQRLLPQEEVAAIQKKGQRYLLDETTAVTRFIFPCHDHAEAALVRYFVDTLFAEAMVQLTNAEDEIWMVESGMKNRVHIWRKVSDDGATH